MLHKQVSAGSAQRTERLTRRYREYTEITRVKRPPRRYDFASLKRRPGAFNVIPRRSPKNILGPLARRGDTETQEDKHTPLTRTQHQLRLRSVDVWHRRQRRIGRGWDYRWFARYYDVGVDPGAALLGDWT